MIFELEENRPKNLEEFVKIGGDIYALSKFEEVSIISWKRWNDIDKFINTILVVVLLIKWRAYWKLTPSIRFIVSKNFTDVLSHKCATIDAINASNTKAFGTIVALEHLKWYLRSILYDSIFAQQFITATHIVTLEYDGWIVVSAIIINEHSWIGHDIHVNLFQVRE